MINVYLCGPINACTDEECNKWRELATKLLTPQPALPGAKVFELPNYQMVNPMRRDYRGIEGDHTAEIVDLDLVDVRNSQVIFACCPKPSVGTSMEIYEAHRYQGIPVVAVVPEGVPVSPWLRRHVTKIVPTVAAACEWIISTFGPVGNTNFILGGVDAVG